MAQLLLVNLGGLSRKSLVGFTLDGLGLSPVLCAIFLPLYGKEIEGKLLCKEFFRSTFCNKKVSYFEEEREAFRPQKHFVVGGNRRRHA